MGDVNRTLVYAIADVLGTTVTFAPDGPTMKAKETRTVNLSGLKVDVSVELVSTRIVGDVYMVLAKSIGNLAMFIVAKEVSKATVVDLHFLNLARMDAATGWLEKQKPRSVNEALKLLDRAVVASFVKLKKNEWSKAA
jgi:hypothetical protein